MERQSHTFQTRQWLVATDVVVFRRCVASIWKAPLIAGLLSAFSRARSEVWLGPHGRDAENVGGGGPLTDA